MTARLREAPEDTDKFFLWLKKESEKFWKTVSIDDSIFGFQIQKGTRWIRGLSEKEISDYEKSLGFPFPEAYKKYLRCMNGTDKETINVYGRSGEPYRYGPGFYSYPRDLDIIKTRIECNYRDFGTIAEKAEQEDIPHLIPIVSHRFLVADRCKANPVISIQGTDSILYSDSLESFLYYHVFEEKRSQPNLSRIKVRFWLR